jgi:hypothetical protein
LCNQCLLTHTPERYPRPVSAQQKAS